MSNYTKGVESLNGLDVEKLPGDDDAIRTALSLMDAALNEARQIRDENSGFFATLKAQVTGTQLDAMKGAVATFERAAITMHAKGEYLLANPHALHDDVVQFVRSVSSVSNISALKDNANMAKLSNLVKDVSNKTLTDLGNQTKALSTSIWDGIPTGYKIGGAALGVGLLLWKFR